MINQNKANNQNKSNKEKKVHHQSNQIASDGSKTPSPSEGTDENIFYPITLSLDHRWTIKS
jgi:hypothetical protein